VTPTHRSQATSKVRATARPRVAGGFTEPWSSATHRSRSLLQTCCTRKNSPSRPPFGALARASSRREPGTDLVLARHVRHGKNDAVGDTFSVSTSLSRSTAFKTNAKAARWKRSTSSGVRAIRASPAGFFDDRPIDGHVRSLEGADQPAILAKRRAARGVTQPPRKRRRLRARTPRRHPSPPWRTDAAPATPGLRQARASVDPLERQDQRDRQRKDGPFGRADAEHAARSTAAIATTSSIARYVACARCRQRPRTRNRTTATASA